MMGVTFGQPLWFWAFALLPVLLFFFARNERLRKKLLRQLVAARLQDRLAGTVSIGRRRWRFLLLLIALACLIVSLAQPRLGYTFEESRRKGRDVIIAIDCSRSMLATDLAPSRLGRAKLAAQDFIGQLQGDRIGLIAFAGSAFLQAPLTIDYGAVLSSLTELDTSIIPRGGTNIASAIKEAVDAFGKGESDNRCLIIFTDGEELDTDGSTAAEAQKGKIKIFTVGLGSADGSLIPVPAQDGGTGFVKDSAGQIVKSKLDEDRLRKIAESTGGFYVHLLNGPAEMKQIVRDGLGQMKEQEIDVRMSRRPIERYEWPLAAGLALLVISALISERKRRGRQRPIITELALAFAALFCMWATQAEASSLNPGVQDYREGVELLNKSRKPETVEGEGTAPTANDEAKKLFESAYREFGKQLQRQPSSPTMNFNLGVAAYRLGKDDEAISLFSKALLADERDIQRDAEGYLGNTLYRTGEKRSEKAAKLRDWKGAVAHYDEALKITPDRQPILNYRQFVQNKIDELEKEPPQSDQQKQDQKKDDEKKDQQDKKDQKDQDQSGQEDQKKDDQQKDSQGKQQEKKDQQSQKSEDGKKEDQPKDGSSQDKDQEAKNEENKDGKDGKDGQPKPEKGDEKKDAKDESTGEGENAPEKKDGQKPQPAPSPDSGEKKQGDIQQAQGGQPQPNSPQQEAEAEAQAAAEGKMTEAQARNLLESLKGEDDRVQLLKPGERRQGAVFRDW